MYIGVGDKFTILLQIVTSFIAFSFIKKHILNNFQNKNKLTLITG